MKSKKFKINFPLPMSKPLHKWQKIIPGGIIASPGNSRENETGRWDPRLVKFFPERCINCLLCWPVCPDEAIIVKNGKMVGIDLKHCKNCGHCISACPVKPDKALEMVDLKEDQSKFK